MYALIINDRIWELFADKPEFHPDAQIADVGAVSGVAVGWTRQGDTFSAPKPPSASQADLVRYANERQWVLATAGVKVSIGGKPVDFATDAQSQALLASKIVRLSQTGAPSTVAWQTGSGFVDLGLSDLVAASSAIDDRVQSTFDALKAICDQVRAGKIATTAQVDEAFTGLRA